MVRFKSMILVLSLTFPRETTGATFFHQYENGNPILNCSQQAAEYVWYKGQKSSLQQFEIYSRQGNTTSEQRRQCVGNSSLLFKERILNSTAVSAGGIFACVPLTKMGTCPLFSSISHCNTLDFFVVAIRNRTAEELAFGDIPEQPESLRTVPEQGNFTLACEFEMKFSSAQFALYWIKDTGRSTCLTSVSNEGGSSTAGVSYDVNCCVDAAFKERRVNRSEISQHQVHHNLTIFNATANDSGRYLCVVATWKNRYVWTIAYNVSIEVGKPALSNDRSMYELQISGAVIGVIILISGIAWLLCRKKKSKGNPVEQLPRNQPEMEIEGDDCSPYAVSSRSDIERIVMEYSVITDVQTPQKRSSPLPDGRPTSEFGEKVQPIYSVVSK